MRKKSSSGTGFASIPSRKTRKLADLLDKRLGAYALAASAAGVGLLASASPAEANSIVLNSPDQTGILTGTGSLAFSLGSATFTLKNTSIFAESFINTVSCTVYGACKPQKLLTNARFGSNLAVTATGPGAAVRVLPVSSGALIGAPGNIFSAGPVYMAAYVVSFRNPVSRFGGPWAGNDAYLGLQYEINGQLAYGWAEIGVQGLPGFGDSHGVFTPPSIRVGLLNVASDSCPGYATFAGSANNGVDPTTCEAPIQHLGPPAAAPEPGTLGLLAIGAAGLALWRKKSPKPKAD